MSQQWRILVVEGDEYLNQGIVNSLLKDGYSVQGVLTGAEAIRILWADEQQLVNTYDAPPYVDSQGAGGFPFMDIGNRYLILGASYDPASLRTNPKDPNSQPLSQQDIAGQLSTGNKLSKNVLGTANYLTAAICLITHNQPSNVCSDSSIQHIEASLSSIGQSNPPSGDSSLVAVAGPPAADVRRKQV